MADTAIEWANAVWNPLAGCTRVSPGCQHCYAEILAHRLAAMGQEKYRGLTKKVGDEVRWTGEVRFVPEALDLPLRWKAPRRIFVNSMSDLFHEKVLVAWQDRIFDVMARAPQHTFQILTKRPALMARYMKRWLVLQDGRESPPGTVKPLHNVWLGVSVEDQATADERIPLLLRTPAAVRWVSYEPALGPVDFTKVCDRRGRRALWMNVVEAREANPGHAELVAALGPDYPYTRLDWIVVGGESGPGSRPFDLEWARQTIAQCRAAGVPVFCKQLGARPYDSSTVSCSLESCVEHDMARVHLRDRKGGDPDEWPSDLRLREFPVPA